MRVFVEIFYIDIAVVYDLYKLPQEGLHNIDKLHSNTISWESKVKFALSPLKKTKQKKFKKNLSVQATSQLTNTKQTHKTICFICFCSRDKFGSTLEVLKHLRGIWRMHS